MISENRTSDITQHKIINELISTSGFGLQYIFRHTKLFRVGMEVYCMSEKVVNVLGMSLPTHSLQAFTSSTFTSSVT